MPAGRPTEYEPAFVDRAFAYAEKFESFGDVVPTIEGLCVLLKISKPACYDWAEAHKEFSDALDAIRVKQGNMLQNGGLLSKYAPVITKLMLSANHGMAEKSETDHTSKGEKIQGITVEFVKAKNTDS